MLHAWKIGATCSIIISYTYLLHVLFNLGVCLLHIVYAKYTALKYTINVTLFENMTSNQVFIVFLDCV